MTKYLEIGQIVNTFGIKGMVKVKPFTDDNKRFDRLEKVYIKNKEKLNEFSENGKKIVKKYYTKESFIGQYRELYEELGD